MSALRYCSQQIWRYAAMDGQKRSKADAPSVTVSVTDTVSVTEILTSQNPRPFPVTVTGKNNHPVPVTGKNPLIDPVTVTGILARLADECWWRRALLM